MACSTSAAVSPSPTMMDDLVATDGNSASSAQDAQGLVVAGTARPAPPG